MQKNNYYSTYGGLKYSYQQLAIRIFRFADKCEIEKFERPVTWTGLFFVFVLVLYGFAKFSEIYINLTFKFLNLVMVFLAFLISSSLLFFKNDN